VRRWTGGGIVLHGEDLTYALVIPSSAGLKAQSSLFVYTAVHEAIGNALRDAGVIATLAPADATSNSEACFERPVMSDVMVAGRKVAGAAHRRNRRGLLHQGSIQNIGIFETLAAAIAGQLAVNVEERILDKTMTDRAAQIARVKYATPEWLRRW
jgi:lipoate-protein ligase A